MSANEFTLASLNSKQTPPEQEAFSNGVQNLRSAFSMDNDVFNTMVYNINLYGNDIFDTDQSFTRRFQTADSLKNQASMLKFTVDAYFVPERFSPQPNEQEQAVIDEFVQAAHNYINYLHTCGIELLKPEQKSVTTKKDKQPFRK